MSSNTFGTYFSITTWGESHGPAIGAVIDGCPAGLHLSESDFSEAMKRRLPENEFTTKRKEADKVYILSGVEGSFTLGTPISLIIYNNEQDSSSYDNLKDVYRPGHADYTYEQKYGIRDYKGGGRASGRETAARVAAGVVAGKILEYLNIQVNANVISIKGYDMENAGSILNECQKNGDSLGGITQCVIEGLGPGIGEPIFNKLDAMLAAAMMSIPGAKGFEIGAGFESAKMKGSECNDPFYAKEGRIFKKTNNSGGMLGGISDGDNIVFRVAFKPTPSIAIPQDTVNNKAENLSVTINGKHDCCYCLRTPVIVEAMTKIVLADLILANCSSRIEKL